MNKMKDYINARKAEGKNLLFVATVGDNFYWSGQDGSSWDTQWANVYGVNDESSPFYNVPWMAVQGNHDLGTANPGCACGQKCNQFTQNSPYSHLWWMPDYNWHYEIPQLSLEIIGLDTNGHHVDELNGAGHASPVHDYCGGRTNVQNFLGDVTGKAFDKVKCRAQSGTAKTVVLLQHYPAESQSISDTFWWNKNRDVQYVHLTGHTHAQKCQRNGDHGCYDIMTGGGGGCTFDADHGGFAAVHLNEDGSYTSVIDRDDVNVPKSVCSALEFGNSSFVL